MPIPTYSTSRFPSTLQDRARNDSAPTWIVTAATRLEQTMSSHVTLLLAMLLVNSIWLPYRGLVHDAKWYAFEVKNQMEGFRYVDALTECYIQSGKFSLFATLVKPVVYCLGVHWGFFLVYLVCKVFLLYAMLRFVSTLIPERRIAVPILFILSFSSMMYGGLSTFHINECFLTPRLPAIALSLLGLERLLRDQPLRSLLFLIIAATLHPIMAIAGLLIWANHLLLGWLTPRKYLLAVGMCVLTGFICLWIPSIGLRIFGEMDLEWRTRLNNVSFFGTPLRWLPLDWVKIALAMLIVGGTACFLGSQKKNREFLWSTVAVALIGLVGSLAASQLPYALLFQAQSYRTMWLVQFLQVPLCIYAAYELWRRGTVASALLAVPLATLFLSSNLPFWLQVNGFFAGIVLLGTVCGFRWTVDRVAGAALFSLATLTGAQLLGDIGTLTLTFDVVRTKVTIDFWWRLGQRILGPFLALLVVLGMLAAMLRLCRSTQRFGWAALALALSLQVLAFRLPYSTWNDSLDSRGYRCTQLIKSYVAEHPSATDEPLTIYWPGGELAILWFDVEAKSYFCPSQLAGNMFLKSSAMEGKRRAELVANFDLFAIRELYIPMSDWARELMEGTFGMPMSAVSRPTWEDLKRLESEPAIDLVVTHVDLQGPYAASDGQYFIYDLRDWSRNDERHHLSYGSLSRTTRTATASCCLQRSD